MRIYTDEDIAALKGKWSIDRVIEPDLSAFGLSILLRPFTVPDFDRYVDDSLRDVGTANEALLMRHALFHTPAEIRSARGRCPGLPKLAFEALAGDAGFPTPGTPARAQVDPFDAATPPLVLQQAGLEEAKAEQLLAELGARVAKVVSVVDDLGEVIFGAVLGAPGEAELGLTRRAEAEKKGYATACRGAADGCLVWTRSSVAETWKRYPAIPVLVLAEVIGGMGGTSATARFRRR
jgi:voltage-gated potassium channel Kch